MSKQLPHVIAEQMFCFLTSSLQSESPCENIHWLVLPGPSAIHFSNKIVSLTYTQTFVVSQEPRHIYFGQSCSSRTFSDHQNWTVNSSGNWTHRLAISCTLLLHHHFLQWNGPGTLPKSGIEGSQWETQFTASDWWFDWTHHHHWLNGLSAWLSSPCLHISFFFAALIKLLTNWNFVGFPVFVLLPCSTL